MVRPLAALVSSVASKVSRLKTAFLWRGIRPPGEESLVAGFSPPPGPTAQRWDSSLLSWDAIPRTALHYTSNDFLRDPKGSYEDQVRDLKTRLVALGTYKPKNTPDEIMNDPRLELEKFHLLDYHVVSQSINDYVQLCNKYDPSSSEVAKNELLLRLRSDREEVLTTVFLTIMLQSLFGNRS